MRLKTIQQKPLGKRRVMYFCKLCRNYEIKERLEHLKNRHNANPDALSKRSCSELLDSIFLESKNMV